MYDINIEYLYEAARLGTMRAAAQWLTVSPSSVSRQITQLEEEIGAAVFEHGARTIRLTEAGQLLVDYYKEQRLQRELFLARLADLKRLRRGRVSLAVGEGFLSNAFSAELARFAGRHSGLQVDVRVLAASSEVARLVVEDEADLGLVFDACADPRVRVAAAVSLPLCAIVVPSHPLARQSAVTLGELSQHALCLPEDSSRTRQILEQMELAQGITLQPGVTCNSIALLKSLLLAGDLCTLLPPLGVADELARGELRVVPIDGHALPDTSAQLITRLGRRLLPAPLSLTPVLKSYLDHSAARLVSLPRQPGHAVPARLLA